MRILDNETGKALREIIVYFTRDEMSEVQEIAEAFVKGEEDHHYHMNDENFEREIIFAMYTDENLHEFDERSRKLIVEGK